MLVINLEFQIKRKRERVGFEVLRTVAMKNSVFIDITPCSAVRCNRRFVGVYRLPFSRTRTLLAGKRHVPPNLRLTFNGLNALFYSSLNSKFAQSINSYPCLDEDEGTLPFFQESATDLYPAPD
jgi:hypothetical protein